MPYHQLLGQFEFNKIESKKRGKVGNDLGPHRLPIGIEITHLFFQ